MVFIVCSDAFRKSKINLCCSHIHRISETEDAKVSGSGSRPQSMVVTIQNGNKRGGSRPISLVVPQEGDTGKETGREKEEKKRRSWYQGGFFLSLKEYDSGDISVSQEILSILERFSSCFTINEYKSENLIT